MKKNRKRWRGIVAAVCAAVLLLPGCGGKKEESGTGGNLSAQASAIESATPPAAPGELAEPDKPVVKRADNNKAQTAETKEPEETLEPTGEPEKTEPPKKQEEADTTKASKDTPKPKAATPAPKATKKPEEEKQTVKLSGYYPEIGGTAIGMNQTAAPILKALGKENKYFESKSCAFKGKDKNYYYDEFELYTYPMDGVDYINGIYFTSQDIATKEGLHIGDTLEDMIKLYGEDYEEEFDVYTYKKERSKLVIMVMDGVVSSIEYQAVPPKGALAQQ